MWNLEQKGLSYLQIKAERTKLPPNKEELPKNDISVFKNWPGFLNMGASADKSFAKIKIEEQQAICAIYSNNDVIAITSTGKYYLAKIDPKKGGALAVIKNDDLNMKGK